MKYLVTIPETWYWQIEIEEAEDEDEAISIGWSFYEEEVSDEDERVKVCAHFDDIHVEPALPVDEIPKKESYTEDWENW